jgi:hypothetical protein
VPPIPMEGLPLERAPVVEGRAPVDVVPMERREQGASGRTRGSEVRPGRGVVLEKLINLLDTRGQLLVWEGPSKRIRPSAGG